MAKAAAGAKAKVGGGEGLAKRSDPWTDLALTLPIFVVYHLGVALLPIRNAADPVTAELKALANHSLASYAGLTLAIGAAFVVVLALLGRGHALHAGRFVLVAIEGALYALLMRFAGGYVVGSLRLARDAVDTRGPFTGIVMSLGAGFYEEVAFRVVLFGLVALVIRKAKPPSVSRFLLLVGWGVAEACAFSAWHYVGSMGDGFQLESFVFRAVCGLVLTAIFAFRGFAPAVWTHALYDIWAMVLK
jgi:hypothetical protein